MPFAFVGRGVELTQAIGFATRAGLASFLTCEANPILGKTRSRLLACFCLGTIEGDNFTKLRLFLWDEVARLTNRSGPLAIDWRSADFRRENTVPVFDLAHGRAISKALFAHIEDGFTIGEVRDNT